MEYIFLVISGAMVLSGLAGLIWPKFGHKVFKWHHVTKTTGFDGASAHGTCTICGKDCMQDSQGNWF